MKKFLLSIMLAFVGVGAMAQWASDPEKNMMLLDKSVYGYETAGLADGSWYLYYDRPAYTLEGITPYLQYYDKDGNALWETPLEVCRAKTKTYTVVNQHLLLDKDNNAIVVAQDLRRSLEGAAQNSYTAYKINQNGDILWRDGVSLHGEQIPDFCAALKMIQLADGSYVFAWEETMMSGGTSTVRLQRVSADGEVLWGEGKLIEMESTAITYPYLVDAGNNEFIIAYAQGASQELYARKLDFDGNDVWAIPTLVYNGTLPSTPLWTWVDVIPAEGGMLITWPGNDPEQALLAYIKADGSHAFTEAEKGLRLGYNDYFRSMAPILAYDKENKTIYAAWREFDPNSQSWQRIVAQRVSPEGELLWDPEGVEVAPLKQRAVSYYDIQLGPKGTVMTSFMENIGGNGSQVISAFAVLLNSDGRYVWNDTTAVISNNTSSKSKMYATPLANDQWIFVWSDNRDFNGDLNNSGLYGQNLRVDGTLGVTVANECRGEKAETSVALHPNPASDYVRIRFANPSSVVNGRIELLNASGSVVATMYEGHIQQGENLVEWNRPASLTSGFYVVRAVVGSKVSFGKVILK